MDLRRAKEITRNFIRNGKKESPIFTTDWIIKPSNEDDKIYIKSKSLEKKIYLCTKTDFVDLYLFNSDYLIEDKLFKGFYVLTSIGLITENDFYRAQDIVEKNEKSIPEAQMNVGSFYISEKGREYLYLGNLKIKGLYLNSGMLNKVNINTVAYLYDTERGKIVNKNSIKIIDFSDSEGFEEGYSVFVDIHLNKLITDYLNWNEYSDIIYAYCKTEINNVDFLIKEISSNLKFFKPKSLIKFLFSEKREMQTNSNTEVNSINNLSLEETLFQMNYEKKKYLWNETIKRANASILGNSSIPLKEERNY